LEDKLREEVTLLHAQICSALADPNRILIIYSLSENACNVNEIARRLNMSQPTVSRHLKVLRERGIVRAERDGQNVHYRVTDMRIIQALNLLRASLADILGSQAMLAQSAANLEYEPIEKEIA
jgi:DNA-binding transcriptional ArsR family regulator